MILVSTFWPSGKQIGRICCIAHLLAWCAWWLKLLPCHGRKHIKLAPTNLLALDPPALIEELIQLLPTVCLLRIHLLFQPVRISFRNSSLPFFTPPHLSFTLMQVIFLLMLGVIVFLFSACVQDLNYVQPGENYVQDQCHMRFGWGDPPFFVVLRSGPM